ncbi:HK97 family phage prohead protease [Megasphaera cerevisiae]|nr:HK97 family phage prohead protease [Megasphaera cerevisiae]SKA01906.1 hypothetical protein SAMN05660900_02141 [Megasphaera cerevisiae DSM 20462]
MNNKEYRSAPLAVADQPEDNQMIVTGYAAVLEQPTVICSIDGINYYEVIDKDAFVGADLSDVPFKYNHSDDFLVLARTRNKTLDLNVDTKGLLIKANLAPIQAGKDVYGLIQRGDIDKMSFGFTVANDSYDSQTRTRRILKFEKIWDVSAVDTPAYDGTSIDVDDGSAISARSYFSAKRDAEKLVQKEQAEQQNKEQRDRLYLMTL